MLPYVHDLYAMEASFDNKTLKLLLVKNWQDYERDGSTVVGLLCFTDVDDLDSLPPPAVEDKFRAKIPGIRIQLGRFKIELKVESFQPTESARQLMEQVEIQRPIGEPLNSIEQADGGFVVYTSISEVGRYYVQGRSVSLCPLDAKE